MGVTVTRAVAVAVAVACHTFCQSASADGCFDQGTDYYGHDVDMIRDGSVTSAEECQRRCQANPQCGYFTFFSDNNQCYLKSPQALSQRRTGPSVQTRISGPRDCECFERGVDYRGHDIIRAADVPSASNPLECQKLCQENERCHYFTFFPGRQHCFLKNADAPQSKVRDSDTAAHVSGPRNCEMPPATPPEENNETLPEGNNETLPEGNNETSPEGNNETSPEENNETPGAGDSGSGIQFLDQSILKVTATRSPAHFRVKVGSCYTINVDKAAREMHVEGAESHKGTIPGEPVDTGSFVLLIFHDGDKLAAIYDYQVGGGDWASLTVRTPSSPCKMNQMTISGVPSSEGFENVRAFVTADLKHLM